MCSVRSAEVVRGGSSGSSESQVFDYTPPTQSPSQNDPYFIPSTPPRPVVPPQQLQPRAPQHPHVQPRHPPTNQPVNAPPNQVFRSLQAPLANLLSNLKALPPPKDKHV